MIHAVRFLCITLLAATLSGCAVWTDVQKQLQNATMPSPAPSAQARVGLTGWQLECGSATSGLSCREYDRMTELTSKTVLAELSVSMNAKTKQAIMLIQLPLGIVVADQVMLRVGKRTEQRFPIITCNQVGCFARDVIHGDLIKEMMNSRNQLHVLYNVLDSRLNRRTFTVTLGLGGFAEAYAKLK
jgi:invasion protein IalB